MSKPVKTILITCFLFLVSLSFFKTASVQAQVLISFASKNIALLHKDRDVDYQVVSEYKAYFENKGWACDLIDRDDLKANLQNYDLSEYLLFVTYDTDESFDEGYDAWGQEVGDILKTKPVLLIGHDYGLLHYIGVRGGISVSTYHESQMLTFNTDHQVYNFPRLIIIPPDGIFQVYTTPVKAAAHYRDINTAFIEILGTTEDFPELKDFIFLEDGKYMAWGFTGPPSLLTIEGEKFFLNSVEYLLHDPGKLGNHICVDSVNSSSLGAKITVGVNYKSDQEIAGLELTLHFNETAV